MCDPVKENRKLETEKMFFCYESLGVFFEFTKTDLQENNQ